MKGYVSGPALTTMLAEQLGVEMEKQNGVRLRLVVGDQASPPARGPQQGQWSFAGRAARRARAPSGAHRRPCRGSRRARARRRGGAGARGGRRERRARRSAPAAHVRGQHGWTRSARRTGARSACSKRHVRKPSGLRQKRSSGRSAPRRPRTPMARQRSPSSAPSLRHAIPSWRKAYRPEQPWRPRLPGCRPPSRRVTSSTTRRRRRSPPPRHELQELRAAFAAREAELAGNAASKAAMEAEVTRLEAELTKLRDQHSGSKDALGALTAQVDELREGATEAQHRLDEARTEAAALEAAMPSSGPVGSSSGGARRVAGRRRSSHPELGHAVRGRGRARAEARAEPVARRRRRRPRIAEPPNRALGAGGDGPGAEELELARLREELASRRRALARTRPMHARPS